MNRDTSSHNTVALIAITLEILYTDLTPELPSLINYRPQPLDVLGLVAVQNSRLVVVCFRGDFFHSYLS